MADKSVSFVEERQCKGCRRWRNVLLFLFVLCWFCCSIFLLWGLEDNGILEKPGVGSLQSEGKKTLLDQYNHNRSKRQLRALALLISSFDQGRFYECMNMSVASEILSSSFSEVLEELHSEMDWMQGQRDPDSGAMPYETKAVKTSQEFPKNFPEILFNILYLVVVAIGFLIMRFAFGRFSKPSHKQFQQQKHFKPQNSKGSGKWSKKFLFLGVLLGLLGALWIFVNMKTDFTERRKETLVNMCEERARMLQDQFNVSMNQYMHWPSSAIDQQTFAEYTARTAFERPLMSGVACALRVLHAER